MLRKSTFMSEERYDIRNIQIYLEFKKATKGQVIELSNLVYNTFFENIDEDFIISSIINNKNLRDIKKIKKCFDKIKYRDKKSFEFNCLYDGFLKTDDCKTYGDINRKSRDSIYYDFDDDREEQRAFVEKYDFTSEKSVKNSTFEILNIEHKKYIQNGGGADIGFVYQVLYMDEEYNLNKESGYFGGIQWHIGGYTCGENYNKVVNYLEEFFNKVTNLIDFVIGNICFVPAYSSSFCLPFHSYFEDNEFIDNKLKELDKYYDIDQLYCKSYFKYEKIEFLKSVEWLSYLPIEVLAKIDKNLMNDNLLSVRMKEDKGVFIKIDKDIKEVLIADKLTLRKHINNILVKGYSQIPYDTLRWYWEEVPIYYSEIIPVEEQYSNEYEILFVSDGDLKYLPEKTNE